MGLRRRINNFPRGKKYIIGVIADLLAKLLLNLLMVLWLFIPTSFLIVVLIFVALIFHYISGYFMYRIVNPYMGFE